MGVFLQVGIHSNSSIIEGCLKHKENSTITCAAYSPDGTTLSVSCSDGHIRFYQVSVYQKNYKILYSMKLN